MDSDSIASIISIGILVLCSAYFSAAETAFSSLNHIRIKNMAEGGSRKASLVLKLYENYDKLLSTILVGNNIVNIAAASLATVLFVQYYGNAGTTLSTLVTTVVVLIFAEISPKSMAKESPEKFAMFSAPSLSMLIFLMTPVNYVFSQWKKLLSKLFRSTDDKSITEEELLTIIEEAEQDGAINEDDKQLFHSVIDFNDSKVSDILTPRVDIIAVSRDSSIQKVKDTYIQTGYSRIPVYESSIDNIIGVIHIRDFFELTQKDQSIHDILAPVIFVTPYTKISDLLKMLQTKNSHLAVATDEYGGTVGIVTMEDILEELVGEIWDEHDETIEKFTKLDDGRYKVACNAAIDEMLKFFKLTHKVESSTVSGWVIEQLGTIPKENDSFHYENLFVTVSKMHRKRVVEIIVEAKVNADH